MASYVVRRILWLIPILFAVSVITFSLMHLVPGGPWATEKQVAPGVEAAIERKYHLGEPAWQQYGRWVIEMAQGDFGPSFKYGDRSINQLVTQGLGPTLHLGLMAFVLGIGLGVPLGVIAALGHNRWPDYLATTISVLGIATPTFVLAILLVVFFSVGLKIFPAFGWGGPETWVLPVIALGGFQVAQLARYTRASMLEVSHKEYIVTAHSKGLLPRTVVMRHMVRNALIPVATVLGPMLAFLINGSFIIEAFFGVPGIGKYYVQGIAQRDYGLIMAMTVIYAVTIAVLNTVVDILYGYIDPRIRYR
ncbi:MAG TPA: ABC transporter permease [Candidatus Limnocylindrales bacterium]|nr:ABC transporter permease [Candidatus Limnocylindrales bacterium]